MLDRALSECIDRAIGRLPHACREAPACAAALVAWAARLSPTGQARDYFDGARSIMFLLPWWLEKRIRPAPDLHFQERLVESTVHGYYFVRMIDDVMDEDAAEPRRLLPLLGILHARFSHTYARLFAAGDPFWDHFDQHWSATAEAALREKQLTEVSLEDFIEVAARKTAGIKISLAAVCCRYDRPDLLAPWCAFYDRFACWQQMLDDTFDWMRDLQHGNTTYFLSEGNRQKRRGESISGWVIRRGFAWAVEGLAASMQDLRQHADPLDAPELLRFLEYRDAEVREHAGHLTPRLREVAVLANVFEPLDEGP